MWPPLRVDRVGDALPAGDLLLAVDARGAGVAFALRRDLRGLGDDQPGGGALRVVVGVQRPGHVVISARLRVSGAMTMRFDRVTGPRRTGANRSLAPPVAT